MIKRSNRGLVIKILGLVILLIILVVAIFFLPYPYSQLWETKDDEVSGSVADDVRYMFEINGIESPKDVLRQFENHPESYKFYLDDDWVVMYAYPDPGPEISWTGMVFIHHIPSVSEVVLDYDGNVIYEQIASEEVKGGLEGFLNDSALIEKLQNQMAVIWKLNVPGEDVLGFVHLLTTPGFNVVYLGGRPQTLFDAQMYLIQVNHQEIRVYEFQDEVARKEVSDSISPDGYEFTKEEDGKTIVIHIAYLGQPNYWVSENMLVQYLGQDNRIIDGISSVIGDPITNYSVGEIETCNLSPYPNVFFPHQEPVEEPREVMDSENDGNFVYDNGCLRVESLWDDSSFLPIWPPDFILEKGDVNLEVLDGNGNKVALVGEGVFMDGWFGSESAIPDCIRQQLTSSCDGPFWIVGEHVRPNWRHDSNIFNLEVISSDDRSVFLISPNLAVEKWITEAPQVTGKLVVNESMRCPRVRSERGDLDYLPVWPSDYSARISEDVVEIMDGSGDVIAREGDDVDLRGGPIPATFDQDHYHQLYDGLPDDGHGPYWIFFEKMR
jgi:hypothetical protein